MFRVRVACHLSVNDILSNQFEHSLIFLNLSIRGACSVIYDMDSYRRFVTTSTAK